jgi:hypothetical protein
VLFELFSLTLPLATSGGESTEDSFSLSLPPFLDFFDCCWPIGEPCVEAAGGEPEGECGLPLDSREAKTERRVGASLDTYG